MRRREASSFLAGRNEFGLLPLRVFFVFCWSASLKKGGLDLGWSDSFLRPCHLFMGSRAEQRRLWGLGGLETGWLVNVHLGLINAPGTKN